MPLPCKKLVTLSPRPTLTPPNNSIPYTACTKLKGKASEIPSTSAKRDLDINEHFNYWRRRKQAFAELFSSPVILAGISQLVKQQRALLSSLAQRAFELENHAEQGQGLLDAIDHSWKTAKHLSHTAM